MSLSLVCGGCQHALSEKKGVWYCATRGCPRRGFVVELVEKHGVPRPTMPGLT